MTIVSNHNERKLENVLNNRTGERDRLTSRQREVVPMESPAEESSDRGARTESRTFGRRGDAGNTEAIWLDGFSGSVMATCIFPSRWAPWSPWGWGREGSRGRAYGLQALSRSSASSCSVIPEQDCFWRKGTHRDFSQLHPQFTRRNRKPALMILQKNGRRPPMLRVGPVSCASRLFPEMQAHHLCWVMGHEPPLSPPSHSSLEMFPTKEETPVEREGEPRDPE